MTPNELLVLCVVIMVGMAAGMLSAFTAGWRLGLDTVRDQDRVILEVLNRIEQHEKRRHYEAVRHGIEP